MSDPVFLTVSEVADRYRVSATTVRRWWAKGELPPPIRRCGTYRWAVQDLEEHDVLMRVLSSNQEQPA